MALRNIDLKKMQALMMIEMKVGKGMNNEEIAKALSIHPDTVERRLLFAKKAGMFVKVEQQILERLVPKALNALETALEDGDAETAMELMKAIGILPDPKAPKSEAQKADDNELFKAINEIRQQEDAVDGEIVTGRKSLAGLIDITGNETEEKSTYSSEHSVEPKSEGIESEIAESN